MTERGAVGRAGTGRRTKRACDGRHQLRTLSWPLQRLWAQTPQCANISACRTSCQSLLHTNLLSHSSHAGAGSAAQVDLHFLCWCCPHPACQVLLRNTECAQQPCCRTLASYLWNCRISGAMYSGEPHSVSASPCGARDRAKPKSAIFSSGVELLSLSSRF
jgi:hypothetical protein